MKHKTKVSRMVKDDPELLDLLNSVHEPQFRSGPATPAYAERKHKHVVYLSGVNEILLKKMVQDEQKADSCTKVTKSVIVNHMIEYFLENHTNAKSRKM